MNRGNDVADDDSQGFWVTEKGHSPLYSPYIREQYWDVAGAITGHKPYIKNCSK